MSFNWNEQTVVVTGAYGGLGKVLCQQIAQRGAKLIITGRNPQQLKELKIHIPKAQLVIGDVMDTNFHQQLTDLLQHHQSHGHILINNAGISAAAFLESQQDEDIKHLLEVNLLAPIVLSKKLLPWLKNSLSAKIINIGSTFGAIGYPGFSTYSASKFGLRGFSQALNRELADSTVSVQYLAPRAIATSINSAKVDKLNKQLKNAVDEPEKIVPQILKAIEKNNHEKFFGFPEKLFAKINGLFPTVVTNSIKKQLETIKNTLN